MCTPDENGKRKDASEIVCCLVRRKLTMQTNSRVISNETKTLEKENVSSSSFFPEKGGNRGEGYRNDVKVKKKRENGSVYTVVGLSVN